MTARAPNLNSLWSFLLIDELVRNGIHFFCISPGSRSTPLTVAVARHPQTRARIFHDERAAAFFALGYARACARPAALICTSGTAVANYLPAVIESAQDFVPMLLLTADRPPELRDTAANQTIEQPGIFGAYLRWSFDMPCPDAHIPAQFVLTTVDQAVQRALDEPRGPVQLNCMFREPLLPEPDAPQFELPAELDEWRRHDHPLTRYRTAHRVPDGTTIRTVAEKLSGAHKPLLTIGRLARAEERESAARLAAHLNIPVLADITSGLRQSRAFPGISHYDFLLKEQRVEFDCILHLGGRMVNKQLPDLAAADKILVAPQPQRFDPGHNISLRVQADVAAFCDALSQEAPAGVSSAFTAVLQQQGSALAALFAAELDQADTLSEPAVARSIARHIDRDSALFLGNSMPVRDFDLFVSELPDGVPVAANRGASGIDGNLATAAGFAEGLCRPVTLVIGDLALLHDLNSLALLRKNRYPVTVVVINNRGGGIFSLLPVARHSDIFEDYFGTPHDLTFEHAAAQFGLEWAMPESLAQFEKIYTAVSQKQQPALIEVTTDRRANAALHHHLQSAARTLLKDAKW